MYIALAELQSKYAGQAECGGAFITYVLPSSKHLSRDFLAGSFDIKRGYAATLLAFGKRLGTPPFYQSGDGGFKKS